MPSFDSARYNRFLRRQAANADSQREYREGLKRGRVPERDDVARAALASALTAASRDEAIAERWIANVARRLGETGKFDEAASAACMRAMVDRHKNPPRRRRRVAPS